MERTLVIIKPDAMQRGLAGEIIKRIEQRGLRIISLKMVQVTREFAEKHYHEHKDKNFFSGLIEYITYSPVIALVCEGPDVVSAVRQMVGKTNPLEAAPGSIRHDFALTVGRNLIHASDSPQTAEVEIDLWFDKNELIEWERVVDQWTFRTN